jgi:murein tripeptide amidase MpaA
MAWKLVQGYQNKDRLVRDTLNNYDIYIIPIANPDGESSSVSFKRRARVLTAS